MSKIKYSQISGKPYIIVENILDFTTAEPAAPIKGEIYYNTTAGTSDQTATAVSANTYLQWMGSSWNEVAIEEGVFVYNKADNERYTFDGTTLNTIAGAVGFEANIDADPALTKDNTINAGTNQLIVEGSVPTNAITFLEGGVIANEIVRTPLTQTAGVSITPSIAANQNIGYNITSASTGDITVNGTQGGNNNQLFILFFSNNDVIDRTIVFNSGDYLDYQGNDIKNITLAAGESVKLAFVGGVSTLPSTLAGGTTQEGTVIQTLTDAATIAWDGSLGAAATVTMAGDRVLGLITNPVDGQLYTITFNKTNNSNRYVTFATGYQTQDGDDLGEVFIGSAEPKTFSFIYNADDDINHHFSSIANTGLRLVPIPLVDPEI